ncbi:S-layer homology domain-containing protein [Brevibacillus borstelensis]|uniref:S-layer homology domain-containing protein n=1 Tax=Brevibacillus borstelensis TaxID=45462 RepID=UPI0030C1552E
MFVRSSNFYWKKQLIMLLVLVVIASGFPAAFAPKVAKAEGVNSAPGGVETGLISWVDVENSMEDKGKVAEISSKTMNDLRGSRLWKGTGKYLASALNFNAGIEVPKTGLFTTSASSFNQADSEREVFSVQANNGIENNRFPWEFGTGQAGKIFSSYGPDKIITMFGRNALVETEAGIDLKNATMMNIWSASNDWRLSLNGVQKSSLVSNDPKFTANTSSANYYIGAGHESVFDGKISEVILYNRKLELVERQKVNSYLALKYGLTLKDENGNPTDYIASDSTDGTDGTKMWTANKNVGYGNRITGIGLDKAGNLNQKQSKSQEPGANVTIAVGNAIQETNGLNTNEIANDKSFFVFSDTGGDAKFVAPTTKDAENLKRIERIYKVEKTNWQDTEITLQVDKVEGASEWPLYLVVSTDEQFDQNDTFHPLTDGKATFNSAEFADGRYFTIAAAVPVPTAATIEQTVADGNKITVTFDRGVALTDSTGFAITVDGTPIANGDLIFKVDENDATKLVITLPAGTDVTDKTVNIAYDGSGNLKGTNGVPVGQFDKNGTTPAGKATPGGVSEGLLSWVDVERSAVLSGKKIDQLTDLADGGAWMPSGTANDNVPNALNFNGGIQIDATKGYYTRSSNDFNNAVSARELFSVQASDDYRGFPWEFGGKYSTPVVYGASNGKAISTYFGRNEGSLSVNVGDYQLKNGAMLNIWSAPSDWALSLNGKILQTQNTNTPNFASPITSGSKSYYFGAGHMSRFYGKMSETILYNRKLTEEDRNKVNSYLALKYGLTLKDENNAPIDYVASDGTTMWTAGNNTGYGNHITGIGLDEAGALYQKQSKSQVDGANVTIALGNEIKETNGLNTNTIANDKSFFVFSDNGKDAKFAAPTTKDAENLKRIERTYKVEKTNWQDTEITLQVDKVEGASEWPLYLVVSADEQFDQNDAFHPLTDGKVTLNSAEFANGDHFTIAAAVPVPTGATIEQTIADGNKITLTFDRGVQVTDLTGFTITVDGTPVANGGLTFKVDENDATKLVITLPAGTDVTDKTVNISYDGLGNLKGTNGVPVDSFTKNVGDSGATLTIIEPSADPVTVTKPEIKGTAEAGSKVKVVIKNQGQEVDVSDEITVDENGNWTFTPNKNLTDGTYTIEVTATKDGKITTKTKDINVVIPVPTVEVTKPEGKVTTSKPEFSGTATPGATVTVKISDDIMLTTTADENGNWSVTPDVDLPDGTYNVEVTATKDGKSAKVTKSITVDTAPTVPSVDKTALQAKKEQIKSENLKAEDYTSESWEKLQKALQNADAVLADPNATQEEVDEALSTLTKAREGLKKPGTPTPTVDKSKLQAKVDQINDENLKADDYTSESWVELQKALQNADAVLADPNATQEEVDEALSTLTKAREGLKKPGTPTPTVDKSKLQAKVDQINDENLKADDYTSESWVELQKALQKAEAVLADPNATQAEVDEALSTLTKAREGLKKPGTPTPTVDKSKLQAKVDQINDENLKADDYTSESWRELQKALQKAEAVLADPNATQAEVDEALSTLTKAREGLKKPGTPTPTVDKSKLQAKVDQINSENLKAEDYTSESWVELQKALQKAEAVLADPNATQAEVDEALSTLTKAREGLKKPGTPTPTVDKSKLQAKADQIKSENLKADDYTSESWKELQKALQKAEAVLADPNATQKEVDEALSALTKAREGLKKPGEPTVDKSKLKAKVKEINDEDLDEDDYTGSSWRSFEKALKRAEDVLADPRATQKEVDNALADLKKARRDLVTVGKRDRDRDREKDREKTNESPFSFFGSGGGSSSGQKSSEPVKGGQTADRTGYMNGYPSGNFEPNRQVTRAEMAMILVNTGMVKTTSASGTFYDVANQHWAADAIKRANAAGLMNGYTNGTFNPGGGITRAEMATIVYKYMGLSGDGLSNNYFDVPADHWAAQIIAAVSKAGLMAGYPDGTFHPQQTLTRAETVTIINRLVNNSLLSSVNGQSWPDVPPSHWAYKDIEAATKK